MFSGLPNLRRGALFSMSCLNSFSSSLLGIESIPNYRLCSVICRNPRSSRSGNPTAISKITPSNMERYCMVDLLSRRHFCWESWILVIGILVSPNGKRHGVEFGRFFFGLSGVLRDETFSRTIPKSLVLKKSRWLSPANGPIGCEPAVFRPTGCFGTRGWRQRRMASTSGWASPLPVGRQPRASLIDTLIPSPDPGTS
jgi:hypothetical protein